MNTNSRFKFVLKIIFRIIVRLLSSSWNICCKYYGSTVRLNRCCADGKPTRWLSRKFYPVFECRKSSIEWSQTIGLQ